MKDIKNAFLKLIDKHKQGVTKTLTAPLKDGGSHVVTIDYLKKEELADDCANLSFELLSEFMEWYHNLPYFFNADVRGYQTLRQYAKRDINFITLKELYQIYLTTK